MFTVHLFAFAASHLHYAVKLDADGVPTFAPTTVASSSSSSTSPHVWFLSCLRRPMFCYSGQKAVLLPPHLFLAYFQEIIQFRSRVTTHHALAHVFVIDLSVSHVTDCASPSALIVQSPRGQRRLQLRRCLLLLVLLQDAPVSSNHQQQHYHHQTIPIPLPTNPSKQPGAPQTQPSTALHPPRPPSLTSQCDFSSRFSGLKPRLISCE